MIDNVTNDLAIVVHNEEHRYTVGEGEDSGYKVSYFRYVRQIVEGATRQKAFGHKAAPDVHQWHQGPGDRVHPN